MPRAWGSSRARWRASRRSTARPSLRVLVNARAAAGHAVRADPLVGREQLERAASAPSCSRRPIRTPASPSQGDAGAHRSARRAATTASRCRASRSGVAASPIGRAARTTFGHILHFALDAPSGDWQRVASARCCPRASASPSPMPAAGTIARPCCATAASRRCLRRPDAQAALARVAQVAVRSSGHSGRRAPRAAGRRGRSRASPTRARSSASASRSAPRRIEAASRGRRAARSPRSARDSAPAPTAAAASPRFTA